MNTGTHATAAMIAIGDELLSGRTKDKNIAHLATFLDVKGIELREVRIVADEPGAIGHAINALRARYTYIFTSGGIGPTHDDVTSDAIANALNISIDYHSQAFSLLEKHYNSRNLEFTKARKKMARIPLGATLIDNAVSVAPGFQIENIYVMAGVPAVFNAMLLAIESQLKGGKILLGTSLNCNLGEGDIGDDLAQIANKHPQVSIGSYPRFDGNAFTTQIVIRARSKSALDAACGDITAMLSHHAKG